MPNSSTSSPFDARTSARCALLALLWLAGCRSYAGNPNQSLLPPEWTSPTVVASAPPVVYEQAVMPLAPRASRLVPPAQSAVPIGAPPVLTVPVLPPPVPPAELDSAPAIDGATRSLIDDLNRRIDHLQQELDQQRTELDAARSESAAARQAAEQIAADMENWRQELAQVRIALQDQQAEDLQALDDINETLRSILDAEAASQEPQLDALPIPSDVAARDVSPSAGSRR
jgi:hypothetical protein